MTQQNLSQEIFGESFDDKKFVLSQLHLFLEKDSILKTDFTAKDGIILFLNKAKYYFYLKHRNINWSIQ